MQKLKTIILLLLALLPTLPVCAQTQVLRNKYFEENNWIEINLETPGQLGRELLYQVGSLSDVTYLKVSGIIDADDWTILGRLPNLKGLDLTDAVTETVPTEAFRDHTNIASISLPESIIKIESYAFYGCINLASISLPSSLTEIGGAGFRGCSSLTSIEFPESVETIGSSVFMDCSSLTSINIPEAVTELPYYAFSGCSSLSSITIPKTIKSIGSYAFNECSSLSSINIPETITTIKEYTFFGCSSLTSVEIPASVTTIEGNTFRRCSNLTSINIPNGIKKISQSTFQECSSLTSIELPESVTEIAMWAFKDCSSLTSINLPSLITTINSRTFEGCSNLTSIDLSDSITWIAQYAFAGCSGLTSIELPESINRLDEGVFDGCSSLTSITLPNSITSIPAYMFRYCSSLISIDFPETVTRINYGAFEGCSNLTSIDLPPMMTDIYVSTFEGCSSLTSIELPNTLKSIGRSAFRGCSSLTSINLPASLTEILDNAFYDCFKINSITYEAITPIPVGSNVFYYPLYDTAILNMPNAALADIMATASWNQFKHIVAKDGTMPPPIAAGEEFEYNGIFYTVIDPEAHTCQTKAGYLSGNYMLPGNDFAGALIIPETVSDGSNEYSVVRIGDYGFYNCEGLRSINIPATVEEIGPWAFQGCYSLYEVDLKDNLLTIGEWAFADSGISLDELPYSVNYIGRAAFRNCSGIVSLYLPSGIGYIEEETFAECHNLCLVALPSFLYYLGEYAFLGCSNLTEIYFNDGLGVIEKNAFAYCSSLKSISLPESVSYIHDKAFEHCSNLISVTLPSNPEQIAENAFDACERLSSLFWPGRTRLNKQLIDNINNPNLLVYVDSIQFAPQGMTNNIVVYEEANNEWECSNLVLTQGYPFYPEHDFVAINSSMTMDFTQTTPIGVSGGWETIVLPFDVYHVRAHDNQDELTSFAQVTDINTQLPYWLYEADSANEWKLANSISAGVPYIIAMPNNPEYDSKYNITGSVTFTGPEGTLISAASTAPYAVTWPSGHQFRSLWMPLSEEEAQQTMGLNVGIDNLTDDEGRILLPGSAFHVGVTPRPLEGYVTSNGSRMALPVMGGQSHVDLLATGNGLGIDAQDGAMWLKSETDRPVSIFRIDGVCVRTVDLKAGETFYVTDLPKGLYIVAGKKIIMK